MPSALVETLAAGPVPQAPALVQLVALVALAALLAVGFGHPRAWVEAVVAPVAAGAVVGVGALPLSGVATEIRELFPVVAFLAAILVVADVCAREGVFAAVGSQVARLAAHSPRRMLGATFLAAAVVTATLSLDATVVLLTPVVAAAAAGSMVSPRPMVQACVRLANSASLLLPVSNLTNLLALPSLDLTFLGFAVWMAPVWAVVIAVEYVGHRLFFSADLRPADRGGRPDAVPLPRVPVVVVAVMLVGFAVGSRLGLAPAWVAGGAAIVLGAHGLVRRRTRVAELARGLHLSFAVYVLCLGVVVAALARGFLGDAVESLVPSSTTLPALLGIAVLATVLANLVNNLPATLLLIPLVAPLGTIGVLAALIGLNVGSALTYTGSLANLLWRRTLTEAGTPPSAWAFHRMSFAVTPVAVLAATLTLWAWGSVLDR